MPFANAHAATLTIHHVGRLKVEGAHRGIQRTPSLLKELGLKVALAFETIQGLTADVVVIALSPDFLTR